MTSRPACPRCDSVSDIGECDACAKTIADTHTQTSMDVGRPCQGCGSFGRHSKNCYLGDDTDG
jgi:hypothetical protein